MPIPQIRKPDKHKVIDAESQTIQKSNPAPVHAHTHTSGWTSPTPLINFFSHASKSGNSAFQAQQQQLYSDLEPFVSSDPLTIKPHVCQCMPWVHVRSPLLRRWPRRPLFPHRAWPSGPWAGKGLLRFEGFGLRVNKVIGVLS